MARPNLFDYAKKELSQDAFFAWLLQWAEPGNEVHDEKLHACGVDFVKMLLGKEGDPSFRIEKIEVRTQKKYVDIRAEINDRYTLIIEDKINTGEHSGQLERYREQTAGEQSGGERELVCVFLKTGSMSRMAMREVERKGYEVVNRRQLLAFFEKYPAENPIYADFTDRLAQIEESEESWRRLPIGKWHWDCWVGFYQFLDERLKVENWGYVSNPSGGFLGLWWNFRKWQGCNVYWQIEQERLCLKLGEVEENRQELRDAWTDGYRVGTCL